MFSQLVIWGFQVATGVVDVKRALVGFRLANFKPAGGRCCGMGGQIETNRWRGIDRRCRVVVKGRVRGTQEEYKTSQNSHQLCSLCRQVCLSSSVHRHWQQPRHHRCSFVRRVHHSLGKSPDNDCRLSAFRPVPPSAIREKGRMKFQGPSRRARSLVNAEGHNDKDSCTTSSGGCVLSRHKREIAVGFCEHLFLFYTYSALQSQRKRESPTSMEH